jgi:hypothetical protein
MASSGDEGDVTSAVGFAGQALYVLVIMQLDDLPRLDISQQLFQCGPAVDDRRRYFITAALWRSANWAHDDLRYQPQSRVLIINRRYDNVLRSRRIRRAKTPRFRSFHQIRTNWKSLHRFSFYERLTARSRDRIVDPGS